VKRYDGRQTFITFAQRIGREHGFEVSRSDADVVLWEFTGFPAFWDSGPMQCLDHQLTEFFASANQEGWNE
jgi:hypothetical protein